MNIPISLFPILLILITNLGLSQNTHTYWEKTYGVGSGHKIFENEGGASGPTYTVVGNSSGIVFMNIDSDGNQLWGNRFSGGSVEDVVMTPDGGYATVGSSSSYSYSMRNLYVTKISPSGSLSWSLSFGGGPGSTHDTYGKGIIITTDNCIVVSGSSNAFGSNPTRTIVAKIDLWGNILWSKTYYGPWLSKAGHAVAAADSGACVVACYGGIGAGNVDFALLKIDSDGNLLWSKSYGGVGQDVPYSMIRTTDGGYLLGGFSNSFNSISGNNIYLVKTNSEGDTMWTRLIGNGISNQIAFSLVELTDGFVIGSHNGTQGGFRIIKTDPYGFIQWHRLIAPVGAGPHYAYSIRPISDGFLITGTRGGYCGHTFGISKVDTQGLNGCETYDTLYCTNTNTLVNNANQVEDTANLILYPHSPNTSGWTGTTMTHCMTIITGTDKITPFIEPLLYPNPVKGKFSLRLGGAWEAEFMKTIEIFDLAGRNLTNKVSVTASEPIQVECDKLSPGLYLLRISIRTEVHTLKFVIE
jgi:hypothetical protein